MLTPALITCYTRRETQASLCGRAALTVHVSTMANVQHRDQPVLIINLIDDSKLSHPETPSVAPRQLQATGRSRVICLLANRVADPRKGARGQLGKLLLSSWQDEKGVVHFWRASISVTARSKGMGFSPEAFASSKARMDSNSSASASNFW